MFEVIVKKFQEFNVIVKDFSKLDSLVATVKYGTYKIVSKLDVILGIVGSIKNKSTIIVDKVCEILGLNTNVIISDSKLEIENISSIERIELKHKSIREMELMISSKEFVSDTTKSKLLLIADPTVGYFRKLAEFDSISLVDLDNLTLEEMDFILTKMNEYEEEQEGM